MSWRLVPFFIAAMLSLSSSSCVIETMMRRGFSAVSRCGGSEGSGWRWRGTNAGRDRGFTGTTTDGAASP
jgi:hypothetical protein